MSSRGFAFIGAVIAIAIIIFAGGSYAVFNQKTEGDKRAVYENQYGDMTIEELLLDTGRQIDMAAKSGGITPENYDLLVQRVTEIEARGVDRAVISDLRSKLETLSVGGRQSGPTALAYPTQSKPASPNAKSVVDNSAASQNQTDAQTLSSIEQEVKIASQTGGIAYEIYARMDTQLRDLETRGVDTSRVRTELSKLRVSGRPAAPCVSNRNPIFTHHITDISKIDYVVPPPTMGSGPGLKTHSYIGTNNARAPVYAPTDMVLETGAYYDIGPYWLGFRISCEMKLRFIHITDPIDEIKDVFPSEIQKGTVDQPQRASIDQEIKKEISFKAGDLIGYTNTGNWDFGVYDLASKNRYTGDPDWGDSWVYTAAVCPFDYFPEEMRKVYTTKFNTTILEGNPPHGESFCAKYFK